ncbi:uncharacterized protein EI90DRAFT_3042195 [Cantharellus anzutake]|uniref:uncharacterized protein n=1 Tax=Cantharellus anzutake TaxID=1750568 RepID=UPI00190372B6|nr:uncharacterized protein EI90DRAFT_3042195 [Cantharellus anzutake]KAF8338230.1 hypothetical protein EI90DRAFT_3042195 [Cantharellus anzutake]
MKLVKEAFGSTLWRNPRFDLWHIYRSFLPFASSSLYELYGHLSDPVQVFSISGEFSGGFIPLSEDARNAQVVAEAKLSNLPKKFSEQGLEATNYEAEFTEHDICNGIVTCAAISQDGSHVALGFGNGNIEIADINHQCTISCFQSDPPNHPVWIEFILGANAQIATEDIHGNISVLSRGTRSVPCGTLPSGQHPALTALSSNGCFIIRVPRTLDENWYRNVALLHFSEEPSIRLLASPSAPFTASDLQRPSTPQRHTVGFSPGGRYVGAFDANCAFVWSTDTSELVAQYCVHKSESWIFNPGYVPPLPYLIPTPVFGDHAIHLTLEEGATHVQSSEPDSRHKTDESWLKCPFYDLSPTMTRLGERDKASAYSSAIGRVPFLSIGSRLSILLVFFNGQVELIVESKYRPVFTNVNPSPTENNPWYGDLLFRDESTPIQYHLPRASKDGTRFLLQGKLRAPVVVDISQVVI